MENLETIRSAATIEELITRGSALLEQENTGAGAGLRIRYPMLSLFFGREARENQEEVLRTYRSFWAGNADALEDITDETYSSEKAEALVASLCGKRQRFQDCHTVQLTYYWDILDEDFEDDFAKLREKVGLPVGVFSQRLICLFCRQTTSWERQTTQARLEALIRWAEEKEEHLLVLSNNTGDGVLPTTEIHENYRLAANVMLLANSGVPASTQIAFDLCQRTVWTAGYYPCQKNSRDIVGCALGRILKVHRNQAAKPAGGIGVQKRLCGEEGSYGNFVHTFFEKTLLPLLPGEDKIEFLTDLPYTEAVAALEGSFGGTEAKGWWPFKKKARAVDGAQVMDSLGSMWTLCWDTYYRKPAEAWLSSPEGKKEMEEYFISALNKALNYDEMRALLGQEADVVRGLAGGELPVPQPEGCGDLAQWLHQYARSQLESHFTGYLLGALADTMEDLRDNAMGFDTMLRNVQDSLMVDNMEHSVERAYGGLTERILNENPDLLSRYIHPCGKESELYPQLYQVFREVTRLDPIFRCSLKEDIDFRINIVGAAAARDVINICFSHDMTRSARLHTYRVPASTLYCIRSAAADELLNGLNPTTVGQTFLVTRSDRIERLALLPVEPKDIMY